MEFYFFFGSIENVDIEHIIKRHAKNSERERETERQRETERHTETYRDIQRQRDRETYRDRKLNSTKSKNVITIWSAN